MSAKKNLRNLVLVGAMGLGLASCKYENHYSYTGTIDEEEINSYYRTGVFYNDHYLTVESDSVFVTYKNINCNKSLNSVVVLKDGQENTYKNDKLGKKVLQKGQEQYDDYMTKILQKKQEEGLEAISNE